MALAGEREYRAVVWKTNLSMTAVAVISSGKINLWAAGEFKPHSWCRWDMATTRQRIDEIFNVAASGEM